MKILIISDAWHPQVNGVVRTYEYLAAELQRQGNTVQVIGPADFPLSMPMPGYAEIRLTLLPGRKLAEIITSYAPDLIHIATEGPLGWAARNICKKRGLPFSTTYHTHFPDYVAQRIAKFLPFLEHHVHAQAVKFVRCFHAAAKVVFVATPSLESTLRSWGFTVPMARLTRGVALETFHPAPDGQRPLTQFTQPVALYVGRIAIEKNLTAFLDMKWPGSKVLVGDGPSMAQLRASYPHAIFAGKQTGKALADYYRSADVFVFPSRTDTFGMVLTEALACGLPVAAYPVTGPVDIITEPILGALDEDLSKAATSALEHGSPQARYQYVSQHYTWPVVAGQFLNAHETYVKNT